MSEIGYSFKLSIEFQPTMENFARHLAALTKECEALGVNIYTPVQMYEVEPAAGVKDATYAIEVGLFSDAENYRGESSDEGVTTTLTQQNG